MKLKQKTLEKYNWFYKLGADSPKRLVPASAGKYTAIEAFHLKESRGIDVGTYESQELEKYLCGKECHGITVKTIAEDLINPKQKLTDIAEIYRNYPEWVANEIVAQTQKLACEKIGFIPKFLIKNDEVLKEESKEELAEYFKKPEIYYPLKIEVNEYLKAMTKNE